jgi:hypothetical protein
MAIATSACKTSTLQLRSTSSRRLVSNQSKATEGTGRPKSSKVLLNLASAACKECSAHSQFAQWTVPLYRDVIMMPCIHRKCAPCTCPRACVAHLERQRLKWSQTETTIAHMFACQLFLSSKHSTRHQSHTNQTQCMMI